jgi:soluble lytic murein transglycosylase-like protein
VRPRRPTAHALPGPRAASLLAGLALLAGGPVVSGVESRQPPPPVRLDRADAVLLEVGAAVHAGDRQAARARLAALAASDPARAPLAAVLAGLLAHADDDPARALERLDAAEAVPGLDDWRLYVLADCAAAMRQTERARRALDDLLAQHPDSPLRANALVRLAELAWQAHDDQEAGRRIAQGRAERLPRERAVALEQLAWQIATARHDTEALRAAARRLLVLDPLEASRLHVVDAVARLGGGADWRLWLAPDELEQRADALLDAQVPAGALTTLEAIPAAARGPGWRLMEARALTDSGRGAEAYAELTRVAASDPAARARLDWQAALAAAAAAAPTAGHRVDAATRALWQRREREQLLAVARGEAAPDLARRALARLGAAYADDGHDEEAVAAWRQLAVLAPGDTSGAKPLWQRGWEAFETGQLRHAVDLWRELEHLYPESAPARSGRYWTARALERLGDAVGAHEEYRALAASHVADFYARQATRRLAGASDTPPAPLEVEPWPEDPLLGRARLLSDCGLDGLAATELELIAPRAEPRATAALAGLIAARRGDTRESLRQLKRAFPALGTPFQGGVPPAALALYYPLAYRETIARAAADAGLPPALVFGMVHQESGFDPAARSRSGARGLMQLMPSTGREVARQLGVPFSSARLDDPAFSVRLGTSYFRNVLGMFDGNVELALAAYNSGPGRIARLWRAAGPDAELDRFLEGLTLDEPRNYVKRIVLLAASYRSLYPDLG